MKRNQIIAIALVFVLITTLITGCGRTTKTGSGSSVSDISSFTGANDEGDLESSVPLKSTDFSVSKKLHSINESSHQDSTELSDSANSEAPESIDANRIIPSALTITMYDISTNTYGFTWNTDHCSKRSVLQICKGADFDKTKSEEYKPSISKQYTYSNDDGNGNLKNAEVVTYYVYKVEIKLMPNTTYTYRVYDSNFNIKTENYSFKTKNPEVSGFSFVHISDSQVDSPSAFICDDRTAIPLNNVYKAIASSCPEADFIVNTGDIVEYSKFESFWRKMINFNSKFFATIPTMAISGNHETSYRNGEYETFKHFNYKLPTTDTKMGVYYSFDYGNVRFIMINTNGLTKDNKLTDDQFNWLKSVLHNNPNKWTIVSMHNPMYSVGNYGADIRKNGIALSLRKQLGDLFADNNVDLVLQGHDHVFSKTYPIGIGGIADLNPTYQTENSIKYTVNPNGVIYAMNGPAGNQTRYPFDIETSIYELAETGKASSWAEVTVDGNKLTVKVKYTENGTTQIWNSYGIIKN